MPDFMIIKQSNIKPIIGITRVVSDIPDQFTINKYISEFDFKGFVAKTKNQAIADIPITSITELNRNKIIRNGIIFLFSNKLKTSLKEEKIFMYYS